MSAVAPATRGGETGPEEDVDEAQLLAEGALAKRRRQRRQALLGYALVLPSFVIFGIFVFYPFIRNIELGLFRTPPFPNLPKEFVGLDQYGDVLSSSYFLDSLKTTVLFFLLTVPTGIFAGLGLAVLAHQKLRGIALYRTIFSSTVATSVAAASVIFFTLLNPQVGLFTFWLGREGQLSVLQDPGTALFAVSAATVWQNLGLAFILMSAGLQAIPDELYEAARVDGAGAWSRFRNVTIPMMSPTIFFASVVGGILAFQAFGQIDILTEGGPLNKTNVLVYAIYREVFKNNNEGVAAVFAMALFAIVALLTLFQLRFIERRVTYAR
jgi:sn-glycerol 3-phosphate transport system permease protein